MRKRRKSCEKTVAFYFILAPDVSRGRTPRRVRMTVTQERILTKAESVDFKNK